MKRSLLSKISITGRALFGVIKAKYICPAPVFCRWEITFKCNMNCVFCSVKKYQNQWSDISTKEAIGLLNQMRELGVVILNLSGGEPSLREDFYDIVSHARKLGMYIMVSTNGSLIKKRLDAFRKVDSVRFSIDAIGKKHDSLRKHPGAFRNAVEGIRLLKNNNINVMINGVVTKGMRYEELVELCRLAKELNVQIDFTMVLPTLAAKIEGKPSDLLKKQSLLMPDVNWYLNLTKRLKKQFGPVISDPYFYYSLIRKGGLAKIGCRSMDINMTLKPDGSLSMPCGDMPNKVIKANNLKEAWFSPEAEKARKLQGKYWFCKNCYYRCVAFPTMLLKISHLFSLLRSWRSF